MPSDSWTGYLLVIVVLGIFAAGWWWVRRRHTSAPTNTGPDRLLEQGWQFYAMPTTLEPPGTVFRIDTQRRRYPVETLSVPLQRGDEAAGRHVQDVATNMGMLARFLGVRTASVKARAAHNERLVFEMAGAIREQVDDAGLDPVLSAFLKRLQYRVDNRYFVIRECRMARELTYHFTDAQVGELGGEASLCASIGAKGTVLSSNQDREFLLQQKFEQPMRVMFLPEEIKPISAGLAGEAPQLGLRPVREVLVWDEGGEQ